MTLDSLNLTALALGVLGFSLTGLLALLLYAAHMLGEAARRERKKC